MKLTSLEKETIITFNEAEEMAIVYTASERVRDHMIRAGFTPVRSERYGWWFEVPKQAVRIKMPGSPSVYIGGTIVPQKLRESGN